MLWINTSSWMLFLLFFAITAKSLWFFYYFGMYSFKKKEYGDYVGKIALICPVYNENSKALKDCIKSVEQQTGFNQIVFINDGSTNKDVIKTLKETCTSKSIIIDLKKNVGKRKAQYEGMKILDKNTDVVVMIDSDTVFIKDTLNNLLKPMNDSEIGGVTAQILVKNKDTNLITKSTAAMYWSASNIWREAPSRYGFVQVTNGQLSCYRYNALIDLMDRYINQYFMGVNCTMSDDRWLTHHLQIEYNYKIIYEKSAIAYTSVPETLKGSFKMFLRWKMGSLRESILILKNTFKKPILVLDIWWNHLVSILQMIVRITIIISSFFYPIIFVWYLLIMTMISLLFGFEMIWENKKDIPYRIIYTLLNEFYYWLVLPLAIIKIRQQGKWATR